jgi:hypothetical protein
MVDQDRPRRRKIDIPSLAEEKRAFSERIIGQPEAVDAFALLVAKLRSPIKPNQPGPRDIKFLAGPSGVGKTEIVKAFAEILGGSPEARSKVLKIDGGDYQERYALTRIMGSPPGYRGSEDRRDPGSGADIEFSQENLDAHRISYQDSEGNDRSLVVILVDEAEKAHEALHRGFLAVLDDGKMKLANRQEVNFSEAVIFYTSNVGNADAELVREELRAQGADEQKIQEEARKIMDKGFKAAFPPEFQGRIKELIVFKNLTKEALEMIITQNVEEVKDAFAESGVSIGLELSDAAVAWLIEQGYNPTEGARALNKVISSSIFDNLLLAHGGIGGSGLDGKTVHIDKEPEEPGLSFYFHEDEEPAQQVAEKPASVVKKVVFQVSDPVSDQPGPKGAVQQDGTYRVQYVPGQTPPDEVDKYYEQVAAERRRVEEFQRGRQQAVQRPHQTRSVSPQRPSAQPRPVSGSQPRSAEARPVAPKSAQSNREKPEVPSIPARVKADLIDRLQGTGLSFGSVEGYVAQRDRYVRDGIITAEQANLQPEIRQIAVRDIVDRLQGTGLSFGSVEGYVAQRDRYVKAGVVSAEQVNRLKVVVEIAVKDLKGAYHGTGISSGSVSSYTHLRDKYVKAGVGTKEHWDKLIFES